MTTSNINIPLTSARHADTGEPVSTKTRLGGFSINNGGPANAVAALTGTLTLQSELCKTGAPVSDTVMFETVVPEDYVQGAGNITAVVSLGMATPPPPAAQSSYITADTCTLTAFKCNNDGSATALAITGNSQALPTVSAGYSQLSFGINGVAVNPGDRLVLFINTAWSEGVFSTYANLANVTMTYVT